jgi:hypothetical protein
MKSQNSSWPSGMPTPYGSSVNGLPISSNLSGAALT